MCDGVPERLVGGPLQERRKALSRSIDLPERDRLVLAGEVVVEGPQRYAGPVGDVFPGDVLQPPLKRELQGCIAERPAGTELLALAQPQRGGHTTSVAKSCMAGKIAWQAASNLRRVGVLLPAVIESGADIMARTARNRTINNGSSANGSAPDEKGPRMTEKKKKPPIWAYA